MGNFTLKGHVSYAVKRKYKWIAEFGENTCEKCAALDGKEFEENEVPPRPHPNCRCKVEEISVVDEIEAEINEYKEEIEQLKLQANELLGDTSVLRNQIERLMKENKDKELNTLENKLARTEYDVYGLLDKIDSLTRDTIDKFVIENIEKRIDEIKQTPLKNIKKVIDKIVITTEEIRPDLHDGAGFWQVSSSPDTKGKNYLKQENAKVVKSLDNLDSKTLKDFVSKKLKSQHMSQNTVGMIYKANSSVAKAISNSKEFKTFIQDKKAQLINNKSIANSSFYFAWNSNLNLNLALRNADIIDIHLDSNNTLHAKVIDTYDFNYGDIDPKIIIPRVLQQNNVIIPYYTIINIEIPEQLWKNY